MGLVKRERDPSDRRKIILRLTREGDEVTRKLIQNAEAHLERKLSRLDDSERRDLMDAFAVLSRYAEKLKQEGSGIQPDPYRIGMTRSRNQRR